MANENKRRGLFKPRRVTERLVELIEIIETGGSVEDPKQFVRGDMPPNLRSAEAAGEYGEAQVERVIKGLLGVHIFTYERTAKWSGLDMEGIDFLVIPAKDRYPHLGQVMIDAAFNNSVLATKIEKLRRWLGYDPEQYLLWNLRIILSADKDDHPEETLIAQLKKMEEMRV